MSDADAAVYLRECVELARRGTGGVEPNPTVGALVVKDGEVVGRGFHATYGGPHAEVEALKEAGERARGAAVYVSLEPCCTHGKTPPCTDALIAAGVKSVIFGTHDPNPRHAGRAAAILQRAGIDAAGPALDDECRALIAPFAAYLRGTRPFVVAKWAQTLDGKIATSTGMSQWISCEASRRRAHLERARSDGVMVGVNTVIRDDPQLTVRLVKGKNPHRFVVDTELKTPYFAKLLRDNEGPVTIFASAETAATRGIKYAGHGVHVVPAPVAPDGRVDLGLMLEWLRTNGIHRLLVEGGPRLLGAMLSKKLVDRVMAFTAPKLLGDAQGLSAFAGDAAPTLELAHPIEGFVAEASGDDWLLTGRLKKEIL
jgi:diaminohydroxyphosphoribosylaminopyrimidine deaminase / 5-amino-6-(5-phosphoribosylamino)uracil reductase